MRSKRSTRHCDARLILACGLLVACGWSPVWTWSADPLYAPMPLPAIRAELQAWGDSHNLPAEATARMLARWDASTAPSTSPAATLERALVAWGEVYPLVNPILQQSHASDLAHPGRLVELLHQVEGSDFLANNLRAYVGRVFAELRMYDEALEAFAGVTLERTIDPSSVLFYKAVAAQGILETPTALVALEQLLEQTAQVPARYADVAELMRGELGELEPQSLSEISRLMSDSERRLDLGRAGERVQGVQERIVATLDELIKKIEAQQGGGGGGGSGSNNSNQSSSGADDSRVKGATAPGETDDKKFSKEGNWGDLPEKQQAEAKNLINREFPAHYRQAIETYFKKLAGRPATPEK